MWPSSFRRKGSWGKERMEQKRSLVDEVLEKESYTVAFGEVSDQSLAMANKAAGRQEEGKPMAGAHPLRPSLLVSVIFICALCLSLGARISESAREFRMINNCKETIWPAVTPGQSFDGGGFSLKPKQSLVFTAPVGWAGRIWGRTGCNFDSEGNGTCQTADCGTGLKCQASGKTPATLAEFTLASVDYYDVSLVDGFNLPVSVNPIHGSGNCTVAGCDDDLRKDCPKELAVKDKGKTVACRSACDVFDTDEYCCRGVYGNPVVCQPTFYSKKFKEACPTAYSYAYDDPTSIFTCSGTDYIITFCSTSRSQKVCTYHGKKVVCSRANGLESHLRRWKTMLLLISSLLFTWKML